MGSGFNYVLLKQVKNILKDLKEKKKNQASYFC